MSRNNWRKALMMNKGKPDSGTQSATTTGNNLSEIQQESIKESEIANSHETQPKYQFIGVTVPDRPETRQDLINDLKDK